MDKDSLSLGPATKSDLSRVYAWFNDDQSIRFWGGPDLFYPITPEAFCAKILTQHVSSFTLTSTASEVLGFGQCRRRNGRYHLARLAVAPHCRGRGLGRLLVERIMEQSLNEFSANGYSLFVMHGNKAAKSLYVSLGFQIIRGTEDGDILPNCDLMIKPM